MKALVLEAKWEPKKGYVLSSFEKETGKAISGNSIWRSPILKVKEAEKPKIEPDQVLIRVKACGVCGSDIHFYETDKEGYILYPGLTKFPCIIGHEFSGVVEEVGSKVKDFKAGDMVTAEEMIWCGECVPCRNGYPNQCQRLEEIGFTINGAFAEYIAIGAKYCWKINALLDIYKNAERVYETGALVEPTSVAYNAMFVRAGGFKPGGYVAVYGVGPIGLACVALAKAAGATKIIAFDVSENRLKLAKDLGAEYVFNPVKLNEAGTSPGAKVMEITEGQGTSMQIEAAGAPTKTIPEMERSLAIDGKIVQIGRAAERVPMYLEYFQTRAGQIYGSQGHSGSGIFPNVIRLMASGRIDMTKIITSRYGLEEVVTAIARSGKREDGKIMVKI